MAFRIDRGTVDDDFVRAGICKVIEVQILPQSVYTGGDEVLGNIILHRGTGKEFSHVRLRFYGRTVHDAGGIYTNYIPQGPELFDISAVVYVKHGKTAAVGPMLWPFKFIFPANTQAVSDPFNYAKDKHFHSVHGHRLPPTINPTTWWKGPLRRQIQYWIEAEAEVVPGDGVAKTYTHRVELNYLPSRLELSPKPCPSTKSEFFVHRLKKMCLESHIDPYTSKDCRKCAQYAFTVCMSIPTQTYPGGPFPLNFSIEHMAGISTPIEAPKIKVRKYRVALKAITEYRDDKGHDIKPRMTTVGVMEGKGTTMDLEKLFGKQGNLIPTFKTYDMARRYVLQIEVEAKCGKKKYPLKLYEVDLEILSPLYRPALAQTAGIEPESRPASVRQPSNRVPVFEVTPKNRVQEYRVSGWHTPTAFLTKQIEYEDESHTNSVESTSPQTVPRDHALVNGQRLAQPLIPNDDIINNSEQLVPASTILHVPTVLATIPEAISSEGTPAISGAASREDSSSSGEVHPGNEGLQVTRPVSTRVQSWLSLQSNGGTVHHEEALPLVESPSSDIPDFPPTRFNAISPRDEQTYIEDDTSSSDIPDFPRSPRYSSRYDLPPPRGILILPVARTENRAGEEELQASIGELPSAAPSPSYEVPTANVPMFSMPLSENNAGPQEVQGSIGELPSAAPSPLYELPPVRAPIFISMPSLENSDGVREAQAFMGEPPESGPSRSDEVRTVNVPTVPLVEPESTADLLEAIASIGKFPRGKSQSTSN